MEKNLIKNIIKVIFKINEYEADAATDEIDHSLSALSPPLK